MSRAGVGDGIRSDIDASTLETNKSAHVMMAAENKATPTLEAKEWHLLPLPSSAVSSSVTGEEQEQVEVGVVEIHPNNQKIVYATRRRSDHGRDLGKELIVVQDITTRSHHHDTTSSPSTTTTERSNPITCSFTLRELIQHLNQF
eukprot:scaffold16585_cov69-Skeletonema_dohrnii-CCMP3373.AAC.2